MKDERKSKRFQEEHKYVHEFADEFLIVCPNCNKQAKVLLDENIVFNPANHLFVKRKIVCSGCGYNRKKTPANGLAETLFSNQKTESAAVVIGGNFDWYFQERLWLQAECCGKVLWAINEKHLTFIEAYVSASLRERSPNKNRTLASSLPQWIKAAKNRCEILKTVEKLKEKLNGKS